MWKCQTCWNVIPGHKSCKLLSSWQGKGKSCSGSIVLLMDQNIHSVHTRSTWHFLWQIYSLDHGTDQQRWAGDQRGSGWVPQHDSVQKGKATAIFSLHVCVCVWECVLLSWNNFLDDEPCIGNCCYNDKCSCAMVDLGLQCYISSMSAWREHVIFRHARHASLLSMLAHMHKHTRIMRHCNRLAHIIAIKPSSFIPTCWGMDFQLTDINGTERKPRPFNHCSFHC